MRNQKKNYKRRIRYLKNRNLSKNDFDYFDGDLEDLMDQYPDAYILKIEYVSTIKIWVNIKGFRGVYQISNDGEFRKKTSFEKYIPIKVKTDIKGYAYVLLRKNGGWVNKRVNRLIKEHFEY